MNTKRVLKELGRVAECNPFQMLRPQLLIVLAFLAFGIIAAEGSDSLLPADHPTLDHQKPVNWPEYSDKASRDKAEVLCKGPVVPAGEQNPSPDVVVVRLDGKMVLADTDRTLRILTNKNKVDNVWVIGVCKSHIQKN